MSGEKILKDCERYSIETGYRETEPVILLKDAIDAINKTLIPICGHHLKCIKQGPKECLSTEKCDYRENMIFGFPREESIQGFNPNTEIDKRV